MASGTLPTSPAPPPVQASPAAPPSPHEQFIEEQLSATRTQVRVVEIASALLTLLAATLGYLLVIAIVDHWIVSLNVPLRLLALVVLVGAAGWFIYQRIVPLLVRRINPVYAAYTIEQAEPSLKNSLVNFLLLRRRPEEVHQVVYQALGQRAATDLSTVPEDTAIDRSGLIRMGYILTAVLAVAAAYKILSPKDPFQSVARVVAPWKNIGRPSRVEITNVTPGDVKLFQGELLVITAQIDGLREGKDEASVVYSTIDGQAIDRRVPMQLDSSGVRYVVDLASAADGGAEQSLIYRVEAGDAATKDYRADVLPAPAILVTKIQYDYPKYTGQSAETIDGTGDVSALEGTLVTLTAKANREIDSALLEFDPITSEEEKASGDTSQRMSIKRIDGKSAQVSFYLRLAKDGRSPWHRTYQLQFNTADGHRNTRPIVHTISVKPDLPPLVEILQPEQRRIEVPQNRQAEIEVRAVDHDFALRRVRVVGQRDGTDLLDETLLDSPEGHAGQAIGKVTIQPNKLGLAVGDVLEYWAVAEDNRTAIKTERPAPNVARSRPAYQIEVIDPVPTEAGGAKDEAGGGDPMNADGEGESKQPSEGQNTGAEGNPQDNSAARDGENQESETGEGESGEGSSNQSGSAGENSTGESGEPKDGEPQGGQNTTGGEGQAGEQNSEENQSGEGGQAGENGGQKSGDQSGAGQGGQSADGQPADSQGDPKNSERGGSGSRSGEGGQQGEPSDQPLSNDGSEDADAFERIQEHLRERQQQQGEGQNQNGGQAGEQNADNQTGQNQESGGSDSAGSQGSQNDSGQRQNGDQQGDNAGGGSPMNQQGEQGSGGENQSGGQGEQPGEQPKSGGGNQEEQGGAGGSQDKPKAGGQSGEPMPSGGGAESGQKDKPQGGSDSGQQGGQPMGGQKPEGDQKAGGGESEQPQGGGSEGQQNDQSGGGEKSQGGGGSPMSQDEEQKQSGEKKSGGSQGGGEKQEDGGKSPGNSQKGSDSQGDSGGDRKGGGEQGGGQGSKQPGQDSAGSSSAGEQGDGAANQQGSGETGDSAGGDQVADKPTGRSGETEGQGSRTGEAKDGNPMGDSPRDGQSNPTQRTGDGQSGEGTAPRDGQKGDPSGRKDTNTPGDGSGVPTGGGKPADNRASDTPFPDGDPGGDKAKLEYARKATDMVLDHLKNHEHDPELLDKVGWSKKDMTNFINRWDNLQSAAETDGAKGEDARRRLDDSLRSLGLRPPAQHVRDGSPTARPSKGGADTGVRSRPPKSYAEQYKAFTKSRNNR